MHKVTNIPVVLINPLLTCKLCGGYLIDATTIVECLHSFCRSCILGYLKLHTTCPICDTLLHKTRPHYAIRPDRALQAIVYKLIPDLFEKEMECRRQFYKDHPCLEARSLSPEKRGDITMSTYVIQEEEHISIELAYWQPDSKAPTSEPNPMDNSTLDYRSTYLLCPPDLTVGHLEKLIRIKFELKPGEHEVALFFSSDDLFSFDYTLSDLACLYSWRSHQPMKVYFTIMERNQCVSGAELQPHSVKSTVNTNSDRHGQSFPSFSTCTTSLCENKHTVLTTNTPPSSKACLDSSCTFSNTSSRSPRSGRGDPNSRPGSKFKSNYFTDASPWNVDSPFHKPPQHSIDPVALSSPTVPGINKATSMCSPRA